MHKSSCTVACALRMSAFSSTSWSTSTSSALTASTKATAASLGNPMLTVLPSTIERQISYKHLRPARHVERGRRQMEIPTAPGRLRGARGPCGLGGLSGGPDAPERRRILPRVDGHKDEFGCLDASIE
eukprot:2742370-Prymnesium_polylepis.1